MDKAEMLRPTAREIATKLRETMGCNCDLDNWEPERSTGHSWVCRIHKAATHAVNTRAMAKGDE